MIGAGDNAVCIQRAGMDDHGRPFERPEVGEVYTITSIYQMRYGLGCTIANLDPFPYKGYILFMANNRHFPDMPLGWYFRKLEPLDLKNLKVTTKETEDA